MDILVLLGSFTFFCLVGVPVGSRVQLDIPADLAYGENATGGRPAGDLRFVVDILAAQ